MAMETKYYLSSIQTSILVPSISRREPQQSSVEENRNNRQQHFATPSITSKKFKADKTTQSTTGKHYQHQVDQTLIHHQYDYHR